MVLIATHSSVQVFLKKIKFENQVWMKNAGTRWTGEETGEHRLYTQGSRGELGIGETHQSEDDYQKKKHCRVSHKDRRGGFQTRGELQSLRNKTGNGKKKLRNMTLETWQWCSLLTEFWTFFTCTSTPPTSPSLIPLHPSLAPSSVLNYPAVLSFSRGGWGVALRRLLSGTLLPSFLPPAIPPTSAAQEKRKRGRTEAGGEGGKLPSRRGLGERRANKGTCDGEASGTH